MAANSDGVEGRGFRTDRFAHTERFSDAWLSARKFSCRRVVVPGQDFRSCFVAGEPGQTEGVGELLLGWATAFAAARRVASARAAYTLPPGRTSPPRDWSGVLWGGVFFVRSKQMQDIGDGGRRRF